jgi:hypothetical protein
MKSCSYYDGASWRATEGKGLCFVGYGVEAVIFGMIFDKGRPIKMCDSDCFWSTFERSR